MSKHPVPIFPLSKNVIGARGNLRDVHLERNHVHKDRSSGAVDDMVSIQSLEDHAAFARQVTEGPVAHDLHLHASFPLVGTWTSQIRLKC